MHDFIKSLVRVPLVVPLVVLVHPFLVLVKMLPPQCRNRFWKWESKNSCLLVNLQKSLLLVKKLLQSKLPKSFLTIFRKLENLSTIWKKYPNILHHNFKTHGFTRVGRILAVMSSVQDFRGPGISDIERAWAYIEGSMFNYSKIFYVFHFDWFGRINFQHHVTYFIRLFSENGHRRALLAENPKKYVTWPILTYTFSTLLFMIGSEKTRQRSLTLCCL